MGFMQQEITEKQAWYEVDTPHGREFIPVELVGYFDMPDEETTEIPEALLQYCEAEKMYPGGLCIIEGYGARLSAPGYMDCTDWSVHDTHEGAQKYLDEMYPDDEDAEMAEENIPDRDAMFSGDPEYKGHEGQPIG